MGQTSINFYSWMGRYKALICLTAVLHLIAAWYSIGFLHPDEHFQNFEFMMARWGDLGTAHLPWEFEAKMRPWLLPGLISLTGGLFKGDIFALETLWRFFASALGLSALLYFIHNANLRRHHEYFTMWLVCGFFWFLPFVHARVSGESIGASLFILGLIPFISKRKPRGMYSFLISGLLIGLSIQLRYHIGFMLIGLFAFEFRRWKNLIPCALGICIATLIGVLVDSYGYESFALSPWNYITENILKGRAASFGVSPWYWYLTRIHTIIYPPISLFLVASFLWQWLTRARSLLTALTLPFFLIHCLVGHKEMRFLIPMIPFALVIGGQFYGWLLRNFKFFAPKTWRTLMRITLALSITLSIVSAIKPASNDYAFLYKWQEFSVSEIYYLGAESPFNMYQLEAKSLIKETPTTLRIPNQESMSDFISSLDSPAKLHIVASSTKDQVWLESNYSGCEQVFIASKLEALLKSKRNPALYFCEFLK